MIPEYLLLGHLTRDVLPDGESTPGGTALYSALAANQCGARVGVVGAAPALPTYWPQTIEVASVAVAQPPTFENRYQGGERSQILHAAAPPLTLGDIPPAWRDAPLVHLGPVLAEVPETLVDAFPHALIGVTPQGWMRVWNTPLPSPIRYQPWQPSPQVLRRIDALVLSIEDIYGDEHQARVYAQHCRLVALTKSAQGATLFIDGEPIAIEAVPVTERDPTGAGDVFAAALFYALYKGKPPIEAAQIAAMVAAASVESAGAEGLLGLMLWGTGNGL